MMLFPFSLEDKAAYWEKTVPSHSVSTWAAVKTEFLRKFFPKQKTAKFRNDIQGFKQEIDESMSEAWDRLKGYTRSCPHHGVSKEHLLGIFYRGVLNEIRRALDTASYGSFASLDVEQAEQLIENLAQSDACFGGDYDRTLRGNPSKDSNVDSKLEKLNERFDKLSRMLMGNQRQVSFVDNTQDVYQENFFGSGNGEYVEGQEEVNYVSNQGNYNNSFKPFNNSHPNFSYRSPNVENPQDQIYPHNQQRFQPKQFNNAQARPNQGFNQPRPNFNQQGNFQPRAPNHQSQTASSSQLPQEGDIRTMFQTIMDGQVKGQRETEKRFKEMQLQVDQVTANVKSLEGRVAQVASTSKPPMGTFPGKVETNPKAPCNAILGSTKESLVDDVDLRSENASSGVKKLAIGSESDSRDSKKALEDPRAKFARIVALVEEEERLEREALETSRRASTFRVSQKLKTLHRREDPGKFNIPICLGDRVFEDALCDSGSYANVISWDLVQELGIKGMSPYPTPLTFGDASTKVPKGIIEKFPIMVGDCEVESDLLVVDMVDSKEQPILLGAPFLLTTGALIDYVNCVVTLKHIGDGARYSIVPSKALVGTVISGQEALVTLSELLTIESIPEPIEESIKVHETLTIGTEKLGLDKIALGKSFEREVPSFEEATSQAKETKFEVASSFVMEMLEVGMKPQHKELTSTKSHSMGIATTSPLDSGHFGLRELFDEEVRIKSAPPKSVAKKGKKQKVKPVSNGSQEARPYNLTLKPLQLIGGKLECKVQCKGYTKPFHKARVLLDPGSQMHNEIAMVTLKMANLFNMEHNIPEPSHGGSLISI